jgi:hypothetical protein
LLKSDTLCSLLPVCCLHCQPVSLLPVRVKNSAGGVIIYEVEVTHCGLDTAVAQQFLNRANVDSILQPLGGSEMPQVMETSNPFETTD